MAKDKFDYFDAMMNQGKFALQEAQMLTMILNDFDPNTLPQQVEAMHEIENAADKQNHEIFTHIATEFLTPIDREDIAETAQRLDDIVDYVEDVAQQLYMYDIQEVYPPAIDMAKIIERSTAALVKALDEFRNFKKSKTLSSMIIEVNNLEEEADQIYSQSVRNLYKNYVESPVFIMGWGNVFLRMERCVDSCENVTDMMATIALKNS
ncbi:MAG: DUF47 family protein [Actinomycetia bacterium]|nr:DUF47 family protein [Actinomycetes bacterium]